MQRHRISSGFTTTTMTTTTLRIAIAVPFSFEIRIAVHSSTGWTLQLRKPVSTLSIPGSMKTPCAGGNRDSAAAAGNEEAGIALVGVHSEYPR